MEVTAVCWVNNEPGAVAEQGARVHQPSRQHDLPRADPAVAQRWRRQHQEAAAVAGPIVLGAAAMGQSESSAPVTVGVLGTGDGRGGRHGMWGRRRRSWGSLGRQCHLRLGLRLHRVRRRGKGARVEKSGGGGGGTGW